MKKQRKIKKSLEFEKFIVVELNKKLFMGGSAPDDDTHTETSNNCKPNSSIPCLIGTN